MRKEKSFLGQEKKHVLKRDRDERKRGLKDEVQPSYAKYFHNSSQRTQK